MDLFLVMALRCSSGDGEVTMTSRRRFTNHIAMLLSLSTHRSTMQMEGWERTRHLSSNRAASLIIPAQLHLPQTGAEQLLPGSRNKEKHEERCGDNACL